MTMASSDEQLPRPVAELEQLASYYDTHDTTAEMEDGEWVEPQLMMDTNEWPHPPWQEDADDEALL